MESISKARLIGIYNNFLRQNREYACVVNSVISECKELDPWLPIENAPKDRPIAVYCPSYQGRRKRTDWANIDKDIVISTAEKLLREVGN